MSAEEAKEFETSEYFHTILDLRHWDDLGKEREVPATQVQGVKFRFGAYLI